MIRQNEILAIGTAVKTHGLHGELSVVLNDDAPDTDDLKHVVLCIDGIFVPFRIASQRMRGSHGILLTLDGVDSADEASQYTGLDVYAVLDELPDDYNDDTDGDDGLYAEDLAGFTVLSPDGAKLGSIESVDTSTINTLLTVELESGHDALVPLATEWIIALDPEEQTITMDIPEQLLDQSI